MRLYFDSAENFIDEFDPAVLVLHEGGLHRLVLVGDEPLEGDQQEEEAESWRGGDGRGRGGGRTPARVEGPSTDHRLTRHRRISSGEAQMWLRKKVTSMNLWQSMAIRLVASPTVMAWRDPLESLRLFL